MESTARVFDEAPQGLSERDARILEGPDQFRGCQVFIVPSQPHLRGHRDLDGADHARDAADEGRVGRRDLDRVGDRGRIQAAGGVEKIGEFVAKVKDKKHLIEK